MSVQNATSQLFSMIVGGKGQWHPSTCAVFLRGVSTFNNPRFGPKISSAERISFQVIGQFLIRLPSVTFRKSWRKVLPMVLWFLLAIDVEL